MAAIVVPFRGTGGKRRLRRLSGELRDRLALAMLGDVLEAATSVSRTVVVTSDEPAVKLAEELGAETVSDPGGGQGAAVAAALGLLPTDAVLIVNADVPCVTPYDLRSLFAATPLGGIAIVESEDGRTNALSLPSPHLFQPLYGPRSAERFRDAAADLGLEAVTVAIPNLADDVDTIADLHRLQFRAGPRTQAAIAYLFAEAS
jgi:2-phospho-L-lactate guanylyltransferase